MTYYGYPYSDWEDDRVGALSDVSIPGMLVPPIGLYQAFKDGPGPATRDSFSYQPREQPREHGGSWQLGTKIAIVAGGALAVYLIYVVTRASIPMHEKAGSAAARFLGARYGLKKSEDRRVPRSTILPPESRLLAPASHAEFAPLGERKKSPLGQLIRDADFYERKTASHHPSQSHPLLGAIDYYSSEKR